ncbi:uncharacterized protein LOC111643710 [Copidosoma floridanum]|uniref:uncharacterized protein LOC111643710 n=2 Tax=Copidosoma floridanum TaxID=29053 RepID=UPI000C6FB385|nr:uncharacterized protein LOC111643710 [Copidosoma floridanum]
MSPPVMEGKDQTPKLKRSGIVYRIECECGLFYVGQILFILKLGPQFNFVSDLNVNMIFNLLKPLEAALAVNKKIEVDTSKKIRQTYLQVIKKNIFNSKKISYFDKTINNHLNETKMFLKEHREILVTRADKGGATVVINKTDYINKVERALGDSMYYHRLDSQKRANHLTRIINSTKKLVDVWDNRGVFDTVEIDRPDVNQLSGCNLAKAYGLIKVHKPGLPVRIIVSAIGSPTYTLDKWFSKFFNKFCKRSPSSLKNSYDLKSTLRDLIVPHNYLLVSFDVVSLYSNLPFSLIKKSVEEKIGRILDSMHLDRKEFLDGLDFLINSNYFTFNNHTYKQTCGTPMGGCTSPWIAEIVLESLEKSVLPRCRDSCLMYRRYVDDCLLIIQSDSVDTVLGIFNDFNPFIQFTVEREDNGVIPFLDVTITRIADSVCEIDLYSKDQTPKLKRSGIVYRIECECGLFYVGQKTGCMGGVALDECCLIGVPLDGHVSVGPCFLVHTLTVGAPLCGDKTLTPYYYF